MANDHLSIPEKAALLALMTFVKEASNPDLDERYGFKIEKKVREDLEKRGYITADQSGPRGAFVHELTDPGWRQCRVELAAAAPKGAHKAYRLLYGVLRCLDAHMIRSRLEMADVFLPGDDQSGTRPPEATDVDERIRTTYEVLAAEPGAWVSLTRLRAALSEIPRGDIDEALLRLDLRPRVYITAEANQRVLSDADRAAAIRIGGENKHLLSIERQ